MKVELRNLPISDLVHDYRDEGEEGITGYSGKLDIRPPFQREFVYDDKQRDAVIDTIMKGFPLNIMYWADRGDGTFEIIDGQQRTISICQYVAGDYSFNGKYFSNLQDDERSKIMDYELMIYVCTGSESEKLAWFKVVNIAGEELTPQELRNAVYCGSWITDAKRYFSKTGCPAYEVGKDYLRGKPIRQEYLETAIRWWSKCDDVVDCMGKHQHDPSADELWEHFQKVISWVKHVFPEYWRPMKGVDWGGLYRDYGGIKYDAKRMTREVSRLLSDEDVVKKSGIFPYLFSGEEKLLNIRAFDDSMKQTAYAKQKKMCKRCGKTCEDIREMEADHVIPWSKGGKTEQSNCQMLCRDCNRRKSDV